MQVPYKLYHFPLCPFSRKVRIFLKEKNLVADHAVENFWEKRTNFLAINPMGQVPALLNYSNGAIITESNVICEYLEEKHGGTKLMGDSSENRAEVKRIAYWFDNKFFSEVGKHILYEKVIRYYKNEGTPKPHYLRAAKVNLGYHLNYIEFLLNSHKWLAGNKITLADFSAAVHISVLDYLGHMSWDNHQQIREWYSLIKSRPSFTAILDDNITGFSPPENYANLDF